MKKIIQIIIISTLFAFSLHNGVFAQPEKHPNVVKGIAAYQSTNFEKAYNEFSISADQGVAEAQYRKMEALLSSVGKQKDTESSGDFKRKPASKPRKTSNEKLSNSRRKK